MNASQFAALELPPGMGPISRLTGAQLMGIMLNWGLFGVLTVQVYIYHLCFPGDGKGIKCMVYGLYLLETVQTILSTYDGFQWFAIGWGDLDVLTNPELSPYDSPFFDAVISVVVQLFFAWRIYKLSKSAILSGIIAALALMQGGAGIAAGVKSGILNSLPLIRSTLVKELAVWLGGSALVDTMIAFIMTVLLLRARNDTHRSDYLISRIITMTVETNAVTAGVAILTLVLFVALPSENYFICPPYVLGKLYTNTLLVVFNNRMVMSQYRSRQEGSSNNHNISRGGGAPAPFKSRIQHMTDDRRGNLADAIKVSVLRETDTTMEMPLNDMQKGREHNHPYAVDYTQDA